MLVSVIIPTYNRSKLLNEAVKSALCQTFCDVEILVIDDGSTDDTKEIINALNDERIKYFYQQNKGQSAARNLGLIKSKGQYIAYLDHDDIWPKEYLFSMISLLEENKEYGAAYAMVVEKFNDGTTFNHNLNGRSKSGCITGCFFQALPCLMPSATVFRKKECEGIYWDEGLLRSPDYDFFLRISTKLKFIFAENIHIIKRTDGRNLSAYESPVGFVDGARTLERFYFKLGGQKLINKKRAYKKISRKYKKAAKIAAKHNVRREAMKYLKKAILYYPYDIRLYWDLIKSIPTSNQQPKWKIQNELAPHITAFGKKINN